MVTGLSSAQQFESKEYRLPQSFYFIYGIGSPNLFHIGLKTQLFEQSSVELTYGFLPVIQLFGLNIHSLSVSYNYYFDPSNEKTVMLSGLMSVTDYSANWSKQKSKVFCLAPMIGTESTSSSGRLFYYYRFGGMLSISTSIKPIYSICADVGGGIFLGR